ncbi:MAG TPA: 3-deoxy-D-manno-octulosonic acid transferase [Ideonella sp.]|uniref:3-deoxy-D-manno-octulosonic acid transferase n=1 Tax=Ideonella sp. TaxID=1929293 RepID=UPI002E343842|nr:3-deoxy-D-manno-octulosonic acid transferase [Ideonella sp.]HEX5686514.1 3-deoxy-D-manno-octulosonic acid transferase [Ideonella sp.]
MKKALARAAYSSLLRLATPLYLARLWWRGRREPGYRVAIGERLGSGKGRAHPAGLWIHAVSLGETRAAAALVDALRVAEPGLRLLLTHGTATGRAAGASMLRPGDHQAWLPYDTPGAVRRFLKRHKPGLGVLMETEVWPNLLHEASRAGVTMVLANARLSERSAVKGKRLAALLHPAGQKLALALAQSEADAHRLHNAGVPSVEVCGNLKYDLRPDAEQLAQGQAWRARLGRPIVVAANTREGEEAELLDAWLTLPATRPLLLLVPRHPQRFDEVAALVAAKGLVLGRRSTWSAEGPAADDARADVWLGDSLGEMALYYGLADLGLQGGSFRPFGAHNFIEAAACGCPMLLGPSVFNFAEAAQQALAAGAAWQVGHWAEALQRVRALLADEAARAQAVQAARAFAALHRGAAARMAARILALLPREG